MYRLVVKNEKIVIIDKVFIGNLHHCFGEGSVVFQTIKFTTEDNKHYQITIRPDLLGSVCFSQTSTI